MNSFVKLEELKSWGNVCLSSKDFCLESITPLITPLKSAIEGCLNFYWRICMDLQRENAAQAVSQQGPNSKSQLSVQMCWLVHISQYDFYE